VNILASSRCPEIIGFKHADFLKPPHRQLACQCGPDESANTSVVGNPACELRYVQVQVAMIDAFDHEFLYQSIQVCQIDHHAGLRIDWAGHCDLKRVIVAMSVFIGAGPEDISIFLRSPFRRQ